MSETPSSTSKRYSSLPLTLSIFLGVGFSESLKRMVDGLGGGGLSAIGDYSRQGLIILVILASFFVSRRVSPAPWGVLTLVTYFCLTAVWSAAPQATFLGIFLLLLTTAATASAARLYSLQEFLITLRNTLGWMTTIGFLAYLAGFGWAEIHGTYEYNLLGRVPAVGLYGFNVIAGVVSAILLCLLVCLPFSSSSGNIRRGRTAVLMAVAVVFTLLTSSATGLLLLFLSVPFWLAIRRGISIWLVVFAPLVLVSTVSAFLLLGDILPMLMGRDAGLSGRTTLWQVALDYWLQRPFFGWGYKSLLGPGAYLPPEYMLQFGTTFVPFHFHNDWLQALAETGVVGAALLAVAITAVTRRVWRSHYSRIDGRAAAVMILGFCLINSGVNSSFGAGGIGWFILISFAFCRPQQFAVGPARNPRQIPWAAVLADP